MTTPRKSAHVSMVRDLAELPDDREVARKELDRKLDQALECTFPASDPFELSSVGPISRKRAETLASREAVGVFAHIEDFQSAIGELLGSGFHRAALSLLASERAVAEKLGHRCEKADALEDDRTVPRSAYVSTEAIGDAEGGLIGGLVYVGAVSAAGAVVASGGILAAVISAAALAGGSGGLIGGILARWLGERHAHHLQEQIDRGGLLLWVNTRNIEEESRAVEILKKHSGFDVHVHALPATP